MTGTMIRRGILAAAVAAMAAGTASAGLINGGFETGDFTGWSTNGGSLSTVTTGMDGMLPTEGSYYAHLQAGLGTGVYTLLSQSFSASAGDTICGDFYFQANDYLPYNDNGWVRLLDGSTGGLIATLAYSDVATVGDFGNSGWINFSYTLLGSYTNLIIEMGVANQFDNGLSSSCGLDNVQICSSVVVPLPPAAGLAGLGLLGLAGVKVVRRRK